MSRQSCDDYNAKGELINGFDYVNQCWVEGHFILDCGHPSDMKCGCFGRAHKGQLHSEVVKAVKQ